MNSYTPVLCLDKSTSSQEDVLLFIIKIYSDGALTPVLDKLKPGNAYLQLGLCIHMG